MAASQVPIMSAGNALNSEQQAWIYQQFNGTTFQANAMDVQHEPLYDTVTVAQAATIASPTQFFTNPGSKTLNLTNVTTAKRLDAPQAFTVMGILFSVLENILLADLLNIKANFALELWIGEKSYNRAPCEFYNSGSGIAGTTTISGAAGTFLTLGTPMKGERHMLAINVVIDNQASFYAQLVGVATALTATASGGVGATMRVILDGLHARGVQ